MRIFSLHMKSKKNHLERTVRWCRCEQKKNSLFFCRFPKTAKNKLQRFWKSDRMFLYIFCLPFLSKHFFFCHFPEKKEIFLLFTTAPSQNSVQLEKEHISFEYPFLQHFPMMCKYIKPPEKSMNSLVIIIIIYY